MSHYCSYNLSEIENHPKIKMVFAHDRNDISIVFNTKQITPGIIDFVKANCDNSPEVYDINAGDNERTRVSFHF